METDWVPEGVDIEKPTVARVYDYLLGGSHNFTADRELANALAATVPEVAVHARANRAFMHRAVRYLAGVGIRQFLDLGSGIPTVGNVHEIAQKAAPDARVVYVDIDPVAVAHSRRILAGNDQVTVVQQDLRRPDRILADDSVRTVLDLREPVAVLAVSVLHAISDEDDPAGIVARFRDAVVPGSYLVVSHGAKGGRPEEQHVAGLAKRASTSLNWRTAAEIEALFDGFELVPPGLVWAPLWHPDSPDQVPEHAERFAIMAGVGRKR